MADQPDTFDDIETQLAKAAAATSLPSDDLIARVLADAYDTQGAFDSADAGPVPGRKGGWFLQMSEAFGGWTGLGGLATACAAGVWIGFAPPAALPDPAALIAADDSSYDLLLNDDFDGLLAAAEG